MTEKETIALMALRSVPGIGNVLCRRLIDHFGSAQRTLSANNRELSTVPSIGHELSSSIRMNSRIERAKRELDFMDKNGVKVLLYSMLEYPAKLRACYDAPVLLYVKGEIFNSGTRTLGVVGTRRATPYGMTHCEGIVENLKSCSPWIISGLAYGIDICAHRSALKFKLPTLAVLAHGLDQTYPRSHAHDVHRIIESGGAVLSEYMSGVGPDRENFPSRNRIIAGMSDGLLVVEAGAKGGALITADIAFSYDRELFALPGRLGDLYSEGCNNLIKYGKARLVTSALDMMKELRWNEDSEFIEKKTQFSLELLTEEERTVLHCIEENSNLSLDGISARLGMPSSLLSGLILRLELQGLVRSIPGRRYVLN